MIYLTMFAGILILMAAYQNSRYMLMIGVRRMELRWLCIYFALCLMCLLAGLRAPGVGGDTYAYAIPVFNKVRRYASYGELIKNISLELGYETLAYLCSRALDDIHLLYFMTELLICAPICYFVTHWPKEKNGSLMLMAAWLFIYYNGTYNEMRQWMAMGLGLCACLFMQEKHYKKALALLLAAMLFHYSAIVIMILFGIILYLRRGNRPVIKTVILILAAGVAVIGFRGIVQVLISHGVVNNRYSYYITYEWNVSSTGMQLISRVPVVGGFTLLYRDLCRHDERNRIVYAFLLLDALICGMVERIGFAALRLGEYFGIWQCVAISQLYLFIRNKMSKRFRWVVVLIFFLILLVYWLYFYAYRGFGLTVPYRADVF